MFTHTKNNEKLQTFNVNDLEGILAWNTTLTPTDLIHVSGFLAEHGEDSKLTTVCVKLRKGLWR